MYIYMYVYLIHIYPYEYINGYVLQKSYKHSLQIKSLI